MRIPNILLAAGILAAAGLGQQSGDSNRNYVVNEQGSFQASPSPVSVPNCSICTEWRNRYNTNDTNAPVAWVAATQGTIGWVTTATNSVDIGPANLTTLVDGSLPGPLSSFLRTDSGGSFGIDLNIPNSVLGNSLYTAMLHFAATSPDGFWLSQTHEVTFDPANALAASQYAPCGGTTLNLGDDAAIQVPMGLTFEFYGGTYTQVWVCSNGFLTFGASNTDFTESVTDLVNGPRRIAPWWDDLNPSQYGTITYETTTTLTQASFRVCWSNVAEYPATGLNSFSVTLTRALLVIIGTNDFDIYFDYPYFNSGDGLVGISPGGNIFGGAPATAIDFSEGAHALTSASSAYYEQFNASTNPIDLYGHRIHFDLDTNGYPESQN